MRILFVTNFYPPYHRGGMELTCRSVVDGLGHRGHQTFVLTSRYGVKRPEVWENIARLLHLEISIEQNRNLWAFFLLRARQERSNLITLRRYISRLQPDVVFIWGMWNLHRSLAQDAEGLCPSRVLYRFGDYWPLLPDPFANYWSEESTSPMKRLLKNSLRPVAERALARHPPVRLDYARAYCISHATKRLLVDSGLDIEHARVIHNGVNLHPFINLDQRDNRSTLGATRRVNVLYIGRLTPTKGIDVAVRAIIQLSKSDSEHEWSLTLAGTGDADYTYQLKEIIRSSGLDDHFAFLGNLPYGDIPWVMSNQHILVVPSIWEEPFGRVIVEGMAAGLVVVASRIGGIPEIIEDGQTGLLFEPGEVSELVQILQTLLANPDTAHCITSRARIAAMTEFSLDRMLDDIEDLLAEPATSEAIS